MGNNNSVDNSKSKKLTINEQYKQKVQEYWPQTQCSEEMITFIKVERLLQLEELIKEEYTNVKKTNAIMLEVVFNRKHLCIETDYYNFTLVEETGVITEKRVISIPKKYENGNSYLITKEELVGLFRKIVDVPFIITIDDYRFTIYFVQNSN